MSNETREPKPEPISNGPNARPRDESIAGTAKGLPNDTGPGVEISEQEAKVMEEKLRKL